jgi:hypothetical protein
MTHPSQKDIECRAYQLWELAGQPKGIRAMVVAPYAAAIWQRVTLGSCMPVAGSYP